MVHDHLVECHRKAMSSKLEEQDVSNPEGLESPETPLWHDKQKSTQTIRNLKKLFPSDGSCLDHVLLPSGQQDDEGNDILGVFSDPDAIAEGINDYWGKVFSKKGCANDLALDAWLQNFDKTIDTPFDFNWNLSREEIETAIMQCKHSAPGPDGIPFEAYKSCVSISSEVLLEVASSLMDPSTGPPPDWFNESVLILLPKNCLQDMRNTARFMSLVICVHFQS